MRAGNTMLTCKLSKAMKAKVPGAVLTWAMPLRVHDNDAYDYKAIMDPEGAKTNAAATLRGTRRPPRLAALMEYAVVLNSLKFNLTVPTHYHFLHRFLKVAGLAENAEAVNYASYLVELALPEYSMLRFRYSQVAAAAVYATMSMYEASYDALRQIHQHSTYAQHEVSEVINALAALAAAAPTASLTAVHKKFSSEKMHNVASRGPPSFLAVDLQSPMEF